MFAADTKRPGLWMAWKFPTPILRVIWVRRSTRKISIIWRCNEEAIRRTKVIARTACSMSYRGQAWSATKGELIASGGSFGQTNDSLSVASHTDNLAYYASVNGN